MEKENKTKKVTQNNSKKNNSFSKKNNKVASKKSNVNLSNEELLEKILIKKEEKKKARLANVNKVKSNLSKKSNKKNTKQSVDLPKKKNKKRILVEPNKVKSKIIIEKDEKNNNVKKENNKVSSEDLLNQILLKKEEKKKKKLASQSKSKQKKDVNNEELLKKIKKEVLKDKQITKKIHDKDKKVKIIVLFVLIIFFVILSCIIFANFNHKDDKKDNKENDKIVDKKQNDHKEEKIKQEKYQECLNSQKSEFDTSEEIDNYINELNTYLSNNYSTSVMYEDLKIGFSYSYNEDKVYYAASTIKALDALYIYSKAYKGEINLNDTVTYTSKFKWGSSKYMKTHNYGDKIDLRTLVKYAITVSDNSAHQMLVSYIGYSNLKEFGRSLGAQYTLYGTDNFGHISAKDGLIYMKAINDFINESGSLGEELKSYLIEAEQNDLAIADLGIKAAHKYGQYDEFYHDIGIVYAKNPYVIAILTREGNKNFEAIVKDINKRVYELHELYCKNRENYCSNLVYKKE